MSSNHHTPSVSLPNQCQKSVSYLRLDTVDFDEESRSLQQGYTASNVDRGLLEAFTEEMPIDLDENNGENHGQM